MNKQQYLNELTTRLAALSPDERADILRDVEEHFHEAARLGRSEESVIALLGDPKAFADMMIAETKVKRIQSATSMSNKLYAAMGALFAILVLTPFNLIFVLLPLLVVTLFVFLGWLVVSFCAVSIPISILVALGLIIKVGWHLFLLLAILCCTIAWCAFVVAIIAVFYYLTLFYIKGVSALFKMNLQFIKRSMR